MIMSAEKMLANGPGYDPVEKERVKQWMRDKRKAGENEFSILDLHMDLGMSFESINNILEDLKVR